MELEPPGIRTRYLASYVLQKFVNIKGACILHLILVGILSILILPVKNMGGGGWGGLLNGQTDKKFIKRDKSYLSTKRVPTNPSYIAKYILPSAFIFSNL